MNIDEMQAGPELDELVAEHVMGWTIYADFEPRFWLTDGESNGWAVDDFDAEEVTRTGVTEIVAHRGVFRPSVDIAAAWTVAEKIIEKVGVGWFRLHNICETEYENWSGYRCDFGDYGEIAEAQTAPLAICRAALKAVLGIDKV